MAFSNDVNRYKIGAELAQPFSDVLRRRCDLCRFALAVRGPANRVPQRIPRIERALDGLGAPLRIWGEPATPTQEPVWEKPHATTTRAGSRSLVLSRSLRARYHGLSPGRRRRSLAVVA
jgi:hypothetical protein